MFEHFWEAFNAQAGIKQPQKYIWSYVIKLLDDICSECIFSGRLFVILSLHNNINFALCEWRVSGFFLQLQVASILMFFCIASSDRSSFRRKIFRRYSAVS